ncbi:MAG: glutamyl-tRNA reductase [Verrucomicrobiota bacterium]
MALVCVGISHRHAPLEVREKFAVAANELPQTLERLRGLEGVEGAVLLSTCNRVEIYASASAPKTALRQLSRLLEDRTGGCEFPFQSFDTSTSARHLFRVASGLDSMVLGETEILGQVKRAYTAATELGSTDHRIHRLFQNAFRAAKEVRTKTAITRGATSVGSVAVDLAEKIFGNLLDHQVMILGAGDTSERVAKGLYKRGVGAVLVSNRRFDRATQLADQIGGAAVHFEDWQHIFGDTDILVCSTAAPHFVVTPEKLEPVLRQRAGRPLYIIDLAVPRDVDPRVGELDSVHLHDIDSLQNLACETTRRRESELARCEEIVDRHTSDFLDWMQRNSER